MQALYQLIRKIKIFIFNISLKDKLLFMEAFILTGIMRFKILKVPFNKLKKSMGTVNKESSKEISIEDARVVMNIREKVTIISKHTPWESLCLVQAMTVQRMLKKRGLSTTLYLGVNKDKENNMRAHAWIRCGSIYVTGGNGSGYANVAKFSNEGC